MSNQKKRQMERKIEAGFEEQVTKRDKQIMSVLRKYVADGNPFDRKQQTAFYSGAVWADENISTKNKALMLAIGFSSGIIISLFVAVICIILSREGAL